MADNMELSTDKNHKWIYTYDYAPDSIWDAWKTSDTIPEWIEEESQAAAKRVDRNNLEAGMKMPAFLLLTDSHFVYNGTWDDTMACMRLLMQKIDVTGLLHLGDLSDGLLPYDKTKKIEERCISDMKALGIPVHIVPGNHDYNYFRKNPDFFYPEIPQYYVDYPEYELRLICIDSFDPKEPVRYGFTEYCIHWLETVLRTLPDGYTSIILSHLTPLVRLQAWTKDIRNRNKLIEVLDRYADRILAYINGHNHCDHLFNDLNNGQFPLISINCAKCEYFIDHKPDGAIVPERRLGDRTQESFDIMQIDTETHRIYFTRFGAGSDRIVREHKGYWV